MKTAFSLKSYVWAWVRSLWFGGALLASIGILPLLLELHDLPGFMYVGSMVAGIVGMVMWLGLWTGRASR